MISDVARFDAILSQHRPFGDSGYIHEQRRIAYKRRLEEIGSHIEVARQLLNLLTQADAQSTYGVLDDPVVRSVIQQILGWIVTDNQMVLPLEQCEEVLRETVRHIETGVVGGPLESGVVQVNRLGAASYTPWIWSTERRDDIFGQSFRQLVEAEYGELLCTPSSADIAMLQKATQLLEELLPLLSGSALSHVHLVGVFPGSGNWEEVASSSQFRLTGAIFLNKTTFKNPWWLAEHLLHESLHQKLYDFRHAHSLLARDDPNELSLPDNISTVVSLWNTPGLDASNSWDPHRSLAAFHVYAHLALFCALSEQRALELESTYGTLDAPPAMTGSRKAFERAHYLGENLRSFCWTELGLAGRRLVDWLISILNVLDPSPPPSGSYLHLLLDRYLMEAAKIQKKPSSCSFAKQLAAIIRDEIASIQAVLAAMSAQAEASDFSIALAKYPNLEEDTVFPQVRRLISETLLQLATDGYSLKSSSQSVMRSLDEMVKEMIETSSHKLAMMGAIVRPRYIYGEVNTRPESL
jgi:hypothetical protein